MHLEVCPLPLHVVVSGQWHVTPIPSQGQVAPHTSSTCESQFRPLLVVTFEKGSWSMVLSRANGRVRVLVPTLRSGASEPHDTKAFLTSKQQWMNTANSNVNMDITVFIIPRNSSRVREN